LPLATPAAYHRLDKPVEEAANDGKADEDDRNYDRKDDSRRTRHRAVHRVALNMVALNVGWFSTSEMQDRFCKVNQAAGTSMCN